MHEVRVKGILSASNGMNLYRGCTHGCVYCDSRSTCYRILHDFEDVEVKINGPELLEQALRRKRKRCMIGTGSMCDPYLPLEKRYGLTRRCLEIIERYGFGAAVLTKSDLILRDLDLLRRIHERAKCVVQMTLTTADEALCRILEPNVCTTARRAEVLSAMRDAGIPTVVWMTPILPFINDTEENIRGLLELCVQTGVKGIVTFGELGVTLREGDREYFYGKLDEHFPGLKRRYAETYGNSYMLPSPHSRKLMKIVEETCCRHGILWDTDEIFQWMHEFEPIGCGVQMSMFDE